MPIADPYDVHGARDALSRPFGISRIPLRAWSVTTWLRGGDGENSFDALSRNSIALRGCVEVRLDVLLSLVNQRRISEKVVCQIWGRPGHGATNSPHAEERNDLKIF